MVRLIISDLQDLKDRINININYGKDSKLVASNIINMVISGLKKVDMNKIGTYHNTQLNKIVSNIGRPNIKYETKAMIHSKINEIKTKIEYNKNINANLTLYSKQLLNKVKGL